MQLYLLGKADNQECITNKLFPNTITNRTID